MVNLHLQASHRWNVTPAEARTIRERLRSGVSQRKLRCKIRHVAGVDVSVRNNRAIAAVPVLRFDDLKLIDLATAHQAAGGHIANHP